jgi:hypothetical protein
LLSAAQGWSEAKIRVSADTLAQRILPNIRTRH